MTLSLAIDLNINHLVISPPVGKRYVVRVAQKLFNFLLITFQLSPEEPPVVPLQVTGFLWSWLSCQLKELVCFLAWLIRISHTLDCSNWFSDRQIIRVNKVKWGF